ncbi:ArsR family transcriptional regulator [Streptomyces sp. Tue6028]|uniref:arsenate reductase/protein-tyrosine-phosphatase family protein n=1 Tax=Streptomyces sp. Tue6028 TaxID=2036037 RepID=UPI000BB37D03|nr:ArsR family transcriptional regulator [Streptomyces sp. Tue6028]PBC65759.1 ArsR family transcriptional regulator [Streptomyces sp. Tue6028]
MASLGQAVPPFVHLAAHPVRWRLLATLAHSDYRVRELVTLVGEPQNLISYHLRLLRNAGLLTATRSTFDGRDTYYHLNLDRCAQALSDTGAALHPRLRAEPAPPQLATGLSRRPSVLFLCTGNSARSPMAEAMLNHRAAGSVEVISAGSHPKSRLHPNAIRVLRDDFGTNIADQQPRHMNTVIKHRFDHVISLCDKVREICPEFPERPRRVHWSISDPATAGDTDQAGYPAFKRTAADIDTRIRYLLPVLTQTQEAKP